MGQSYNNNFSAYNDFSVKNPSSSKNMAMARIKANLKAASQLDFLNDYILNNSGDVTDDVIRANDLRKKLTNADGTFGRASAMEDIDDFSTGMLGKSSSTGSKDKTPTVIQAKDMFSMKKNQSIKRERGSSQDEENPFS